MDKTYSVIIPTYNRAHTIIEAVESALAQTLPPAEVIVADDESTDDTEAVIKKMANKKVRYLKIPHAGRPAIPRNAAIETAKGEWLAFLDSDDEWKKEKMEKQLSALEKTGLLASSTNAQIRLPAGLTENRVLYYKKNTIGFGDLLRDNSVICSSTVINRSLIKKTSGFQEDIRFKAIEDYALWLRISTITSFAYISDPLVIYNDDPKNSIRGEQLTYDVLRQKKIIMDDLRQWTKKEHPLSPKQRFLIAANRISVIAHVIFNKLKAYARPSHG